MKARLFRFIKLSEHKRFDYKPLYYDERKEKLQQRIEAARASKDTLEDQAYRPDIKGRFTSKFAGQQVRKDKQAARLRTISILAVLSITAYFILTKIDILNQMFSVLFAGK
ncbi:MAG: hypothetical protein CSB06_00515 [Bacteroidia bacterium]|nr:MAG: hypothetical protein CSB06_00515 [Bacteroidia bacterium]